MIQFSPNLEAPTLKESPEEAKAQGLHLNLTMFVTQNTSWRITLFTLVSVPFSAESQNSNTRLKVTFINNRSTPIKTYWVNYNHNAVHYYTLAPNAQYTQYTFGTHPWIVTDENDNALHFLIPYLTDVQITIQWDMQCNNDIIIYYTLFSIQRICIMVEES